MENEIWMNLFTHNERNEEESSVINQPPPPTTSDTEEFPPLPEASTSPLRPLPRSNGPPRLSQNENGSSSSSQVVRFLDELSLDMLDVHGIDSTEYQQSKEVVDREAFRKKTVSNSECVEEMEGVEEIDPREQEIKTLQAILAPPLIDEIPSSPQDTDKDESTSEIKSSEYQKKRKQLIQCNLCEEETFTDKRQLREHLKTYMTKR